MIRDVSQNSCTLVHYRLGGSSLRSPCARAPADAPASPRLPRPPDLSSTLCPWERKIPPQIGDRGCEVVASPNGRRGEMKKGRARGDRTGGSGPTPLGLWRQQAAPQRLDELRAFLNDAGTQEI